MKVTVFGAKGFIGAHLVNYLRAQGRRCDAINRGQAPGDAALGHVIWCAGVTADFRQRPFDTVAAHVSDVIPWLQAGRFDSFVYVSSTRVYQRSVHGAEDAVLSVATQAPDDLYNVSKLMGESLCLSSGRPGVRVARLSNVYGLDQASDNFLTRVIRSALMGRLKMGTAPASAKDYVCLDEVVETLVAIAFEGALPIYNVATGINVSHQEIADTLVRATGCEVSWADDAPLVSFPRISTQRLHDTFGRVPARRLLDDLPGLVSRFALTSPA